MIHVQLRIQESSVIHLQTHSTPHRSGIWLRKEQSAVAVCARLTFTKLKLKDESSVHLTVINVESERKYFNICIFKFKDIPPTPTPKKISLFNPVGFLYHAKTPLEKRTKAFFSPHNVYKSIPGHNIKSKSMRHESFKTVCRSRIFMKFFPEATDVEKFKHNECYKQQVSMYLRLCALLYVPATIDLLSIRQHDPFRDGAHLQDIMSIVLIMIKGGHLSDGVTTSLKVDKPQQRCGVM